MLLTKTTYYGFTVPQIILMVVALIVVIYIFVTIQEQRNRKKALEGDDRVRVWEILEKNVPDVQNYTRAYARWEWSTYAGRRTTTSYWYYGIAFNSDCIYVVPLSAEGGDISYSNGGVIYKDQLGVVNSKKGANWVELYDKDRKEIVSLMVFAENLKDDKYHPVNIIQTDEEKKFLDWKEKWMEEVNTANGVEATGKMKKPVKNKK